jgi:HlyD family secretion protein
MMNSPEEYEKIELKSEEFHDILGGTPHWILRWGISLILLVVVLFIVGTAFFKYPDTISGTFVLTGTEPPARIKARTSGRITSLFISDHKEVRRGEYLAIIENTTNDEDVKYIKFFLNKLIKEDDSSTFCLPDKNIELGDMQTTYLSFYQSLYNFIEFRKNNYHANKAELLKNKIQYNRNYYDRLFDQQKVTDMQFFIKEHQYKRDSILFNNNTISQLELEETNIDFLNSQISRLNARSSIDNIQIQMTEIETSLMDIKNDFVEKENNYKLQVKNLAIQLLSEIQSWEMLYVLQSPIDGEVSFNNYWARNQNVVIGEDIFNVVPNNGGKLVAKVFIPIARSGKVKTGHKVNLYVDNFPNNEYGMIRGIVYSVSLLPSVEDNSSFYVVEVELPNGLITSYGKNLPYYLEMKGSAKIITEDMSLLKRILLPVKQLLDENR